MKKILITGGAGFIGSHLAEALLKGGNQVFVLDDLSTGSKKNIEHLAKNPYFYFEKGDIQSKRTIINAVKRVDQIYHLAAVVGVKRVIADPLLTLKTNLFGTENVLEAAYQYSKQVLIASSSEVYGKGTKIPFSETDDRLYGDARNLRWIYSQTKALDESLALVYSQRGLKVVIVRLFNIAGPRQSEAYGMVLPSFVKSALANQPITVYGNGRQTRCFCHVDDAIQGLIRLLASRRAEGEIVNLGSDQEISIRALAQKVKILTKSRSKIIFMPYRKAYGSDFFEDMKRRKPNLEKIKQWIAFRSRRNLENIIKDVIDYYQIR